MPVYFNAAIALVGSMLAGGGGSQSSAPLGERTVRVCVRDQQGLAIVNAQIQLVSELSKSVTSDGMGCSNLEMAVGAETKLRVTRQGFSSVTQAIGDGAELNIVMPLATNQENVEVTAARIPLALDASASSVRTMSQEQLREARGLCWMTGCGRLRGFSCFGGRVRGLRIRRRRGLRCGGLGLLLLAGRWC